MHPLLGIEVVHGLLRGPHGLVGTFRRQGIVGIGDGDDAGRQRDLLAREAVRIAVAVVFFMVVEGDDGAHLQVFGRAVLEDLIADAAMGLHDLHFIGGEPAGFEQDLVGDADLADVVHRRGQFDAVALLRCQAKGLGDEPGVFRHADDMVAGFLVAVFTRLGQAQQGFVFPHADFRRRVGDAFFQPAGAFLDDLGLAALGEQVAAAGQAFVAVHWLGEEVRGPGLQYPLAAGVIVLPGEHQQGQFAARGQAPHPLDEHVIVDILEPGIGNDHVSAVPVEPGQAGFGLLEYLDGQMLIDGMDEIR